MSRIMLCINQNDIETPYKFSMTGIEVYSFEEALYHTYNYWKESLEDYLSNEFVDWVKNTLDQKYLATRITELRSISSQSERLIKFLSLNEYYDGAALAAIKAEINVWEQQLEWERLKDMGDIFMNKGEPQKAHHYYKKALASGENIKLLNNMGVCLMEMELFDEAAGYLEKAYKLDKDNFNVLINYIESLIYKSDFEAAFKYLRKAERGGEKAVVSYLYGRLCQKSNNLNEALKHYEKAASLEYDPFYYYMLAECYVKLRKYNKALETLEFIKEKDRDFYIFQAEIYAAFEDYSAAVKCMEKAVVFGDRKSPNLWAILAKYHRLNYNMERAERAALTALNMDKDNRLARLEMARIKKSQGKTRDYQKSLNTVLESFKKEYRDIVNTSE
ncbi:hypothetical protein LJB89_00390 [Tyzzerella sp. OttesenSCG-928-J15]|nr:hypothetical protein [Tyzzerella sp. OttesenSCG-928-J15]